MLRTFLIKYITIASASSLLGGCCKEGPKENTESSNNSSAINMHNLSSHYPPPLLSESDIDKLPIEQRQLYENLNPSVKPIFLNFSAAERADAVAMSTPMPPSQAVRRAANHDAYAFPYEQQSLYFKLSPKVQILFLALGGPASDEAVKLSRTIAPNEAVKQAASDEVNELTPEDQELYSKLNFEMQTLFLTLTPQVREAGVSMARNIDPNIAVKNVSWMDAKRLPKDQQAFYENLDPDEQTLFLILTPPGRSMALQLTKSMNPDTAVQYANRNFSQHFDQ